MQIGIQFTAPRQMEEEALAGLCRDRVARVAHTSFLARAAAAVFLLAVAASVTCASWMSARLTAHAAERADAGDGPVPLVGGLKGGHEIVMLSQLCSSAWLKGSSATLVLLSLMFMISGPSFACTNDECFLI